MHYIRRPSWWLPDSAATPESVYLNRRALLAGMGAAGAAAALGVGAAPAAHALSPETPFDPKPALNPAYADPGRPVTPEDINTQYNNFYEFGSHKRIFEEAQKLQTDGWTLTFDGLCDNPHTVAVDDLITEIGLEERVVRHRCVEAWSMVAPWIGFPISKLLERASPQGGAKFVRFEGFEDSAVARGQRAFWYPWPYVEGLTMAEAAHDLAFMVVGAYGKVLHKQFGAPIRMHAPWKYGFKHIKSITRVSFTEERPVSFWEELQASEYGFWANVNPEVSHPRWSQATERVLGQGDERIPTLPYNGYAEEVAGLYADKTDLGDALYR
ncbi:MAG: protein-methionine-sulfoxide reductase catalytic subunit MsrP [Pseudomonadota bacterium]